MTAQEAKLRLEDHFAIHDDGCPTPYLDEAVQLAYKALDWYGTLIEVANKLNAAPESYILTEAEVRELWGLEE